MKKLLYSAVLLSFLVGVARAQPPAPADTPAVAPQTEMQKWIEATDTQWQVVFKRDVTDVHEAEAKKLMLQSLNLLEEAIVKASKAGDLDGAVALRAEQKRFGDTQLFPEQDAAADPAAVKQVRAGIRTLLAKLKMDSATRAKALHTKYDQVLAQAQTQLTQAQRLDDALLVKAKREEVAKAWLSGASAPPPPAPVALEPPKPPVSAPKTASASTVPMGARLAENMTLYFAGNNYASLVINGKEPLAFTRSKAVMHPCRLREGDVIAVRLGRPLVDNSLWVSCIASSGEFLFETTEEWMGYIPADQEMWWDVKSPKEEKPVQFAPDTQYSVEHVKIAAQKTPLYRGAQPVRGEVSDDPKAVFIYHVVTKADLVPKKVKAASTVIPNPAAPAASGNRGVSAKVVIISAIFGAKGRNVNVTRRVLEAYNKGEPSLILKLSELSPGNDPVPQTTKATTITYTVNGEQKTNTFKEGHKLVFKEDLK